MKILRAPWSAARRVGRWIADRLKDLFYAPGNKKLDNGRLAAFGSFVMVALAVAHNIRVGQPIDLGPTGLLGGLAALLAAVEIYLVRDRKARGDGP